MSSTSEVRLGVVVSGWPRVSETFALNELLALRRAGMLAAVFATKPGDPSLRQPGWDEIDPLVEVLPGGDVDAQAAVVAERLAGAGVAGVHGYFAHQPAAVAAAAAARLGVPYGFSAHALDVRKVPPAELAERAAGAAVVVSCNRETAASIEAAGTTPRLVAHGVDLDRFSPAPPPGGPVTSLLAVGRLVEKKGFDVLVEALALVDRPCRLRLVGDGPERPRLEAAVARLGLGDRVDLLGRRTHADLPALYAAADVVVVPSVVDANADRDGLPNVVLEAM
ncbi:MAG TPA: glycosyltransferase, partial [Acidimicrobiales bacterium]